MALPMNSGAEAVETALKAARKWGATVKGIPSDRAEIIVCNNNFHGRTISIVGFSTEPQYRAGFGPFPAGFRCVPFGDLDALARAITPDTCAFLVEPIQGEAGIILPPPGYPRRRRRALPPTQRPLHRRRDPVRPRPHRQALRLSARRHHARRRHHRQSPLRRLLPRLGRTLASARSSASSNPATTAAPSAAIPLACAVARAALRVLVDEDLSTRSAELGAFALGRLQAIRSPHLVTVRGRGLWLALELNRPARPFCEALRDRGVLCKETHSTVIRIAPPLTISRDDLDWGLTEIDQALQLA